MISITTLSATSSSSPQKRGSSAVAGDTLRAIATSGGKSSRRSRAARIAASSSSTPRPTSVRLGEPGRGRPHRLRPEARESLERDDAAVEQVEDGLELDVHLVSIENRANAGPFQLALLALELLAIELIRDDLGQHAQEAHVAIVQGRLGGPAEAAERAVESSVPEPDRCADVGADAGLARDRKIGRALVRAAS